MIHYISFDWSRRGSGSGMDFTILDILVRSTEGKLVKEVKIRELFTTYETSK